MIAPQRYRRAFVRVLSGIDHDEEFYRYIYLVIESVDVQPNKKSAQGRWPISVRQFTYPFSQILFVSSFAAKSPKAQDGNILEMCYSFARRINHSHWEFTCLNLGAK